MNDFGNLSQCVVYGDTVDVARARRLRSRAMALSLSLEGLVIACLLLGPLLRTAVLPESYTSPPVPVVHLVVRSTPPPARQPERAVPNQQRDILSAPALRRPLRISSPIEADAGTEQPPIDLNVPIAGDGIEIGGPDTNVTSIAPPRAKPPTAVPVTMSSGVMAARLIHNVQPEYPVMAKLIHLTGTVQLQAIIGTDGSVQNLQVVSGNPILVKAAMDAVTQWRYQPTLLSGKPVEVETVITVQFHMQ